VIRLRRKLHSSVTTVSKLVVYSIDFQTAVSVTSGRVVRKATVCVEYETKRVDICCRVNADEPGKEPTAVEYLWAHLSGLIIVTEQFLQAWPGLFYKVSQLTSDS